MTVLLNTVVQSSLGAVYALAQTLAIVCEIRDHITI